MSADKNNIKKITDIEYKQGFFTDIDSDTISPGLNENVIKFISKNKNEPQWMLNWRLDAYNQWLKMSPPKWANINIPLIDYQKISYFSAPRYKSNKNFDDLDPKLIETYEKLGVPLHERAAISGIAIDAVFDSVSVITTFKKKLYDAGVIFCSISEAIMQYPEIVKKYIGKIVPKYDNYFAALNSAVFTDGSFVFVPEYVKCPMELSTYFRINAQNTGQFERTLIICDKGATVSYLEGCTAPVRSENQLHAAVVELVALEDAYIKYSTVQNWYPGDKNGTGGILNFVTKRGDCRGDRSRISWTQVETGSAITWKYPSCLLTGNNSQGEFYSVAVTNGYQQVDTGSKMIHIGKETKSTIISKGIAAGKSNQTYRGLIKIISIADNARNFTQCDSLLIGEFCGAHTFPYQEIKNSNSKVEHEATTSKIGENQLFYCRSRGISQEDAVSLIVNGFCKDVFKNLPLEFAIEAKSLLEITLEGSIG